MRSLEADAIEILRAVRIAFHSLLSPNQDLLDGWILPTPQREYILGEPHKRLAKRRKHQFISKQTSNRPFGKLKNPKICGTTRFLEAQDNGDGGRVLCTESVRSNWELLPPRWYSAHALDAY